MTIGIQSTLLTAVFITQLPIALAQEPVKPVTVCEVLSDLNRFTGKFVGIVGRVDCTNEIVGPHCCLVEDHCQRPFVMNGETWPNKMPRPGNLWVILTRMTAPMCSAAPISNGFGNITVMPGQSPFPSMFAPMDPLVSGSEQFDVSFLPPPRVSPCRFASKSPSKGVFRIGPLRSVHFSAHDQSEPIFRARISVMRSIYPQIPLKTQENLVGVGLRLPKTLA